MGEIADMMINGDMDFYTGEWMGKGNGVPRTLDRSLPWEASRPWGLKRIQRNELKVIENWFNGKGIRPHERTPIINAYMEYKGIVIGKARRYSRACIEIQKDMESFKRWYNNNH